MAIINRKFAKIVLDKIKYHNNQRYNVELLWLNTNDIPKITNITSYIDLYNTCRENYLFRMINTYFINEKILLAPQIEIR